MSVIGANYKAEIFRKDHPMIIAQNYGLASLLPVRLAFNSAGYKAGRVLARNSTSGLYENYNDAGSSGLDTARAVLNEDAASGDFGGSTGSALAVAIFGGEVYKDKLLGLDTNGETDLKAKTIIDATGINVLKF